MRLTEDKYESSRIDVLQNRRRDIGRLHDLGLYKPLSRRDKFLLHFWQPGGINQPLQGGRDSSRGGDYTYSSSPGVGGVPGRVEVVDAAANDALVFQMPIPWVPGGVLGISPLLYYTNTSLLPGVRNTLAVVGLLNSNTAAFNARAHDWASLDGALVSFPGAEGHHLALRSVENLTVTTSLSPVLSLRWGWYELSGTFWLLTPESFGYSVRLDWRGEDGAALPLTLASLQEVAQNTRLFAGAQAYLGLAGSWQYGARAFDNVFITIPEPSSWALLVLGIGGLLFWSLRRRVDRWFSSTLAS